MYKARIIPCLLRLSLVLLLLSAFAAMSSSLDGVRAQNTQQPLRISTAEPPPPSSPGSIHPTGYDLHFGDSPFLPSEATTEFGGFLKPEEIPTAAYCARCHAQVHAQWRQSAHANSFRTPWYIKNVNELATTKGIAYTRHCEGCHNPAALLTGALTEGSKVPRPNDEDGITCMVCHSIRAIQSTKGIGSYVMGKPAVMIDASGKPVPGLPSDAEIMAHLDWHKKAVMQPLYHTSEYCAACHKAAMPKMLNDYKWLRTFSTYDEWQQSSWSTETPLTFYKKDAQTGCQGCHMLREPSSDAASRDHLASSHRWLGANTAVPKQYGFDEQAKRVLAYLQDDKLQIDIFGLTVEHARESVGAAFQPASLIAPLGLKPFTVLPGDWVRVDVVVRNKGIGHTFIPELRDFYESWLDFEAKDDQGHTIYRSGTVDDQHRVDPDSRSYGLRILSRDGKAIDHHEVWKTYIKAYDATVSPGRSDVVRYRFRIPQETHGFTVTAAVRYRRFRRAFTDWVFTDSPMYPDRFPTVTMARGSYHFTSGQNAPHPEDTLPPDLTTLLRWNNYGIGMLDRLQYAEAVSAFEHVVASDPKYEPGYVNLAIAEYSRGRYPQSLAWIDKAQHLNAGQYANDPRAMFYKGLCLRWQAKYIEAVSALEPVALAYPRFRQVHQELGYIYMVQRRFNESKEQYEAVLKIDPDDPLTHRWLGPVYAALGDHVGAARETAIAAQTGDDKAAGWTVQRFWRDNLTVASEAMPGHVYSEHNLIDDADVRRVLNLQNPPSYIWIEHY